MKASIQRNRMLWISSAIIILVVAAASWFEVVEQWIGAGLRSRAAALLVPSFDFDDLSYHFPSTITLHGARLTSRDPGAPGETIEILAMDRLTILLTEIPRPNRTFRLHKLVLERPTLRLVRVPVSEGDDTILGFSRLLKEEPVPVSQPAEPPATPSAQFEVRTVTLDDGHVEYDPRDGSAAIMVVDGIHGNLLLQSMSAGSYGLELSFVDEPILALALRAKLQVDEKELDIEALSFKLDLAREQDHYLTPPVQKLLAARDITGRLSAEINGVVSLDDGASSDLHVRFELIDASIAAGSYGWALDRVDARLSATGRTMTIEEFSIDTMGGHATAGGSIELDVPFAAALHFEGEDLQIGDLLRAEELPGGAPSFEGLLTASGTLQCPLAEIGRHAGGGARVSLAKARLGRFPVLSTIDEALDALAEKAMKREHTGHDSLSLELSLGGDRARIKNLRLNSRWYGLRGHGDVGFDSRLDFIAEGGPVQRLENEMGPLGDVLGELTETILRARFTGTLSAPEIGFEPIRQPLSR